MIYGITLMILGVLASPNLVLAKRPNAKEILDKIAPYQGWIGLAFCFWGIWGIVQAILNMGLLADWPIWWITWLASSIIEAVLGFILGYGMISKYVLSKSEEARIKGEQLLAKLAPIQGKLGVAGILVGLWVVVAGMFFYV